MSEDIKLRARMAIAKELGVPLASVDDGCTVATLGGDSLDEVECVMELEKEFNIDIPDDTRWVHGKNRSWTVGEIVAVVVREGGT